VLWAGRKWYRMHAPFACIRRGIGQRPAVQADGGGAAFLKLDPVLQLAIFISQPDGAGVGTEKLVDPHRRSQKVRIDGVIPTAAGEVVRGGGLIADVVAGRPDQLHRAGRRWWKTKHVRTRQ